MNLKTQNFFDTSKSRTFGRLRGRKLSKNQNIGLKIIYNRVKFNTSSHIEFIKKKKCWIEIGSGDGEHLIQQAIQRKNINFVGCEVFQIRLYKKFLPPLN